MREEAFAKFTRPLESQFVYERRPARGLLATAGAIAVAIGATVILALVLFKAFPISKSDPAELAVSISDSCISYAGPSDVRRLPGTASGAIKQFQRVQESDGPAISEPAAAGTAKEAPEKPQALLEKFIQWQQRK